MKILFTCTIIYPASFPDFIILFIESKIFAYCQDFSIYEPLDVIRSFIKEEEGISCFEKKIPTNTGDADIP